jgi:RHS repeat-associated protein
VNFPSTLVETYAYDAVGNLTSKTDRKNQTINYVYDALDRLTTKTYPDSSQVEYVYDLVGKIQSVNDPTGTYAFAYDNMGRLVGTTTSYSFLTSRNFTVSYAYDKNSNRTGMTDPEGGSTTYAYDTLNRLSTLTPPSAFTTGSFGFTYDALSRRTQMTRPNNVTTDYTYDNLSRLLSVLHKLSGGTIDGATYTVDAVGNRTAKANLLPSAPTESYTYDAIYQLTQVVQNGATTTESYTYDPVGNRLSSLAASPWNYNVSNQLTSISGSPGTTFTYDNNGNTTSKTDAAGTTTYTWDYENRLTSITLPNSGGTVSFTYDPLGRRIRKQSASATTIYAYDGENIAQETDAAGNAVARYAMGLSIDEPLAMLRSSATHYYSADGLGSVTSLTDAAGAVAATYTYDTFGNLAVSAGSLTNPFRYTAREWDAETALYFYRARYHQSAFGRFLFADPAGFAAGINFYAYVLNGPTNATDPTGLVIKICNRAGWQNLQLLFPGGVANHSYLLDTRTGENCGRGDQSGKENPSSPGTVCVEVPESAGKEDEVMECCRSKNYEGAGWPFFPGLNDCHNTVERCLEKAGLKSPGVPGGRLSDRCDSGAKPECRVGPWWDSSPLIIPLKPLLNRRF